ncbi:MAG: T9SS type A sorting domain-containing protein, partial [Flavobacteriales bacterium]
CEGTVGVDENFLSGVQVYPNPASNELVVDLGENFSPVIATLTDLSGRIVQSTQLIGRGVVRVDALASGMYILMLESGDARSEVRVMVQH